MSLQAVLPATNPFARTEASGPVFLDDFPTHAVTALKIAHAGSSPPYDIGLFGNSRSLMLGRADMRTDTGCSFFNFSIGGESIRNSVALLEILARMGNAPRIAVVSLDHLELQMAANPHSLPFAESARLLAADLGLVAADPELAWREAAQVVWRILHTAWAQIRIAFTSDLIVRSVLRFLSGDRAAAGPPLTPDAPGYLADGSQTQPSAAALAPPPRFVPASRPGIIVPVLRSDLARLAALKENGVRHIVVYESPLDEPFAAQYARNPSGFAARQRSAFLDICAGLGLHCLAAPDRLPGPARSWPEPSHPPADALGAYLRGILADARLCGDSGAKAR